MCIRDRAPLFDSELEAALCLGTAASDIGKMGAATGVQLDDQAGGLGSGHNDQTGAPKTDGCPDQG
eukprot:10408255-Alexandrium_andersonii.AAC.1